MKRKTKPKPYKERRVYRFMCAGCKHSRVSFKRRRAKAETCIGCEVKKQDERQRSLFEAQADADAAHIADIEVIARDGTRVTL